MLISREHLLSRLLTVGPGISKKHIIEQSACAIFRDGHIITYNDEIGCSTLIEHDLHGAVPYDPLVQLLSQMPEDMLELTSTEGILTIKGKGGRRCKLRMEAVISLPIDEIETPVKWKDLDEGFSEAVRIVQPCAGTDENEWILTNVHMTSEFIEASDNVHAARYFIPLPLKKPCLVSASALKHVVDMGMCHISQTKSWVHFRNDSGLQMSFKRTIDSHDYPDLQRFLDKTGETVNLPKGLMAAASRAAIFTSEDSENNEIRVDLSRERVRITGTGPGGEYVEPKKIVYTGPECSFMINPDLLIKLIKSYNECFVSEEVIKVDGSSYIYITSLDIPTEKQPEKKKGKGKKTKADEEEMDESDIQADYDATQDTDIPF